MQSPEIELKFPVADPTALQSRLPGLGFQLDTARTFEQNILYDTPDRTLRTSQQILRLRRYGPLWTVTHKRRDPSLTEDATRYKVRIETETRVDDGPALGIIFEQLGYAPIFRYEKFRTEWSQVPAPETDAGGSGKPGQISSAGASAHLVIDETPIGNYAELEGPVEWIDRTLKMLDVDPSTCLTDSYGKLFLLWKERTGSPAEHLTFDEVHAAPLLRKG